MSDNPRWILVVGSRTEQTDEEFASSCEAIGTALAGAGFGVITGSFREQTADVHVLTGALRVAPDRVRVVRRRTTDPVPEQFAEVPLSELGESWEIARTEQLDMADGVLLIGGRGGTRDAFLKATAHKAAVPVLPIPCFGGTARQVFEEVYATFATRVPPDLLAALQQWSTATPGAVVRTLHRLLDEKRGPEVGTGPVADTGPQATTLDDPGTDPDGPKADPKEGLVSIERLAGFSFTSTAKRILDDAIEKAAVPQGADAAVTASLLLISILENPVEGTAAAFLSQTLRAGESAAGQQAIDAYFPFYASQVGPPLAGARVGSYPIGWLSPPVVDVLEGARIYAHDASNTGEIGARHLVAALILRSFHPRPPVPGSRHLFEKFGVDEAALRDGLLTWLRESGSFGSVDSEDVWVALLVGRATLGTARNATAMPRIELESPRGRDLLGIDRDVNPLATVLASRALEPPIAVGLFGDWGSGKSFFMEKLHDRIQLLAEESRARTGRGAPSAFHAEVAQIWFNAWNYVETNLWASLVTHIFESLHRNFVPPQAADQKRWEHLLKRLDQESTLGDEAQEKLQVAEDQLARAKLDRRIKWTAVGAAVEALWHRFEAADAQARKVGRELNAEELREVRESLLRRRDEASALLERIPVFRRTLLRGLGSLPAVGAFAVAMASAAAAVLGLVRWLDDATITAIGGQLAATVSVVGGVSAWLGSALRRATRAVDAVETLESAFDACLRSGRLNDDDLRTAEQAMAAASQSVEEHEHQIEKLRTELAELQPSRRLTSFLANRAESQDYRKHLGLPAMIRRDFEHLQQLMDQMATAPFPIDAEAHAQIRDRKTVPDALVAALRERRIFLPGDATVASGPQGNATIRGRDTDFELHVDAGGECRIDWQRLKIDRIVLYIDDLDRCPSERVVEVLQAVRLLLDFKLFVVVVGVDARWVTRALQQHHSRQWRTATTNLRDAAEPQDFLEKIFQIPLWLEPLEADATRQYLTGLTEGTIAPARTADLRESAAMAAGARASGTQTKAADAAPGTAPASPRQSAARPGAATTTRPQPVLDGREEGRESATPAPGPAGPGTTGRPGDEVMNPPGLFIESWERDFMLELAGIVGRSPRSVKRFVNVYRLIRASVAPDQLPVFTGTAGVPGAYQVVQVLLAVIVGKPAISEELFERLRKREYPSLEGLAEARAAETSTPDRSADWQDLVDFLKPDGQASAFAGHRFLVPAWVERVARYSFRVGRR